MGRLYYGDNLDVMRSVDPVLRSPKIASESIDLCYIDPPFNSKRNYNQIYNNIGEEDRAQAQSFLDTWFWDDHAQRAFEEIASNASQRFTAQMIELIRGLRGVLHEGSLLAYLVAMALRITEVHRVLKPTACFYLHCDPNASHYLKLLCDAIFCSQQGIFINEIIWRRTGAHNARRSFGPIHDVILMYGKTLDYYFKSVNRPYMRGHVERRYKLDSASGKTKFTSGGNILTGSGATLGGESGKPWKGFDPTAKNRHWAVPGFLARQMPPSFKSLGILAKLDALYDAGLIDIAPGNAWPTPVRFLEDTNPGHPVQDIWAYQPYTEGTVYGTNHGIDHDVAWFGTTDPERLKYETEKPEGLLERIFAASCPPNGRVLDAYCGCGTTVVVAQKLGFDWIGVDITYQAIAVILRRIEKKFGKNTADATLLDGIPQDVASARALAMKKDDRLRKEFEKWAVLTYTNNRAAVNEKKGADGGIDGVVYFLTGRNETAKMVLQAKSGGVGRKDISALVGDMKTQDAVLATLITLEEPTRPMKMLAKAAGIYQDKLTGNFYDIVQIVTVQQLVEQRLRLNLPMSVEVLRSAKANQKGKQLTLDEFTDEGENEF